ncbi:hypothetical protein ACF0H5_021339 [Mactra antiquata]
MIEMKMIAQYFTMSTLVIGFIIVLQVSYKVSAYRRIADLKALEALNELQDMEDEPEGLFRNDEEEDAVLSDILPTDKRYARLSYYHSGRGTSRRYSHNSRYYRNYYKPWLNLPDGDCIDKKCRSNSDCCRQFSKCDRSVHICYQCWYGQSCRTSRDCCQKYPYCNKKTGGTCQT